MQLPFPIIIKFKSIHGYISESGELMSALQQRKKHVCLDAVMAFEYPAACYQVYKCVICMLEMDSQM